MVEWRLNNNNTYINGTLIYYTKRLLSSLQTNSKPDDIRPTISEIEDGNTNASHHHPQW